MNAYKLLVFIYINPFAIALIYLNDTLYEIFTMIDLYNTLYCISLVLFILWN